MRSQRVHNFGTYFVSTQTAERRVHFSNPRWADLMLATLLHYREQGKYLLHEFVLMPDHLHLILTPQGITLERSMQFIKGGFSRRATVELGWRFEVWQKGFSDHRIRCFADFLKHREYVHMNPVEAHLVSHPADYRYSSAAGGVVLDPLPRRLKPETWVG